MNTQKVSFLKSAASPGDFLWDGRGAAVFAGRSNVGKSSVINCLLNRKNFARVGGTPGKTVQVNYFLVDTALFVDLPGYGYARVSGEERRRWGALMEAFFSDPQRIGLGVLIVDARHRPTADDVTMAEYFRTSERPFCVLANKCDKLKKSELPDCLDVIRETLALEDDFPLLAFSAVKGDGRRELLGLIERSL